MERQRSGDAARDGEFGNFLVSSGLLRAEALRQALDTQSLMGGRLDTVLLDLGLLPEAALLDALGRFRSTRTVSGRELMAIPAEVVRSISPRIALRLEVLPFRREGRKISVATLKPEDLFVEDELALLTDCMIASFITLEVRLYEAMWRYYDIQPSIQVMSVLRRLAEEAAASADAARSADGAPRVAVDRGSPYHGPPGAGAAAPPRRPERPLVLEISREELEEFPSLAAELDGEPRAEPELHARPSDEAPPLGLDDLLQRATDALQNAEMREDVGDAVLQFCAPILSRRLLLVVRGDTIVGWRGEGKGLRPAAVRSIVIPVAAESVFNRIGQGAQFWLGPLPRSASSDALLRALGGASPPECIILPLIVRGKTVGYLYGDNFDRPTSGLPISHLRRLVAKASLAFQIYLLRSKIRHL